MKNLFLTIGCFVVLVVSISGAPSTESCTDKVKMAADNAFARIVLYGEVDVAWPRNENELKPLCDEFKPNKQAIETYIKSCLNGVPRQIIKLVLKGASKMVNRFCGSKPDKSVFDHAVCGNSDTGHDHSCMHKYVQMSKNVESLDPLQRMGGACCSFVSFRNCILNRMKQEPKCEKNAIEFFEKQITSIAGEALDIACIDYNKDTSKCDSILPKMKRMKSSGKSLLLPLTKTMEALS